MTTLINISDVIGAALLVIAGAYGNGDERKQKLEDEGFDYRIVQNCVNDLLPIVEKYS